MAKQLNVDMRFTADTSQAKTQLQALQNSLNQLTTNTVASPLGITKEIKEAQQATTQLKTALSQSMNISTGKFDLSKFNSSLKSMGTDLGKLKSSLVALGPQGQQTFLSLAQSIMTAEIPSKRINSTLKQLGVTLKNTVNWQVTSSMMHGFMRAVQTSYNYAKDLNESLNNIRIVTGQSAEQMDKFAARANKAAQALSTSTLKYSNAALIYYQQGLNDKQVEDRTNITVKMANVTQQSAEQTSDQLTAVWNNFAKGGENLEHFADVMVRLGADTASSSDEIAQGLEKFAAIGDTVGLSFDNAAAALATVTATTRQSADIVGTAFKTLFARIQDLELGDTLEDGTTLGKYSEALNAVGINIKNSAGGLKDMDAILNEMGNKWTALSKDQQVALAQTVAGTRQYTQLIALMDNFDFYQKNLQRAINSDGSLEEQAKIFEESWEASSERVKSAIEEVYSDLLNDDFFIDLNDGLANFINLLDNLLKSMGGAQGLLTGVSSILLNMFSGQAARGLENMVYNFKSFLGLTQQEALATKQETFNLTQGMSIIGGGAQASENEAISIGLQNRLQLNHSLLEVSEQLTEIEQGQVQAILQQNQAYGDQLILLGQKKDAAQQARIQAEEQFYDDILSDSNISSFLGEKIKKGIDKDINFSSNLITQIEQVSKDFNEGKIKIEDYVSTLKKLENQAKIEGLEGTATYLHSKTSQAKKNVDLTEDEIKERAKSSDTTALLGIYGRQDAARKAAKKTTEPIDPKAVDKYARSVQNANEANKNFINGQKNLEANTKSAAKQIKSLGQSLNSTAQTIVSVAQSAMSFSFAISSFKSIGATWADETIGSGEKLLQTFMSLGIAIPMLMNSFKGLNSTLALSQSIQAGLTSAMELYLTYNSQALSVMTAEQVAKKTGMSLDQAEIVLQRAKATAFLQETFLREKNIGVLTAEQVAERATQLAKATGMTVEQAQIVIEALHNKTKEDGTRLTIQEALAEAGLTTAKGAGTIATIAATVANWALQASLSPILAIVLLLTASIAALIVVVWAIVKGIQALSDAYHADAIAAENAAKYADLMSSKYDTLTEKANQFKDAVSNYEEAVNNLKKLEKGTLEYEEALNEANNKAMALIETYGLWDSYSKKGNLIVFKDGILKDFEKQYNKKASEAKIDSYMAKIIANSTRAQSEKTDLQRNVGYAVKTGTYSVQGGYRTENVREFTDEEVQEVINAFNGLQDVSNLSDDDEALKKSLEIKLKENSILANNIDAIIKNKEAFIELANSTKEAAEANKAYAKEITTELISNSTKEKKRIEAAAHGDSELEDIITNFIGSNLANKKNKKGQTLDEAIENIDTHGIGNRSGDYTKLNELYGTNINNYEDLTRLYAEKIGGKTNDELKDLVFSDRSWKGTLKSISGDKTVVDAVSYEEMNRALAQAFEAEKIKKNFDTETQKYQDSLFSTVENLSNSGELGQAILKSLQNGIDQADFSQVYSSIQSEQQKQEMMNLSSIGLMDKLNINEEDLKNLGYKSADDFKKAFNEGLSGWTLKEAKAQIEENIKTTLVNAAEQYDLDVAVLTTQQKQFQKELEKTSDDLNFNAETAAAMAIANQRLNKGVNTLTDNWEDWKKTLESSDKTTQDYAEACVGMEKALKDILSLSDKSFIPDDFLENQENIDLFDQIANGSEEAVDKLGKNLLIAQIESSEITNDIRNNIAEAFSIDPSDAETKFNELKQNLINSVNDMQGILSSLNPAAPFTGEKAVAFAEALNEYARMTGMTADQMHEALSNAGVDAKVKTEPVNLTQKMQKTITEDEVETISEADPESGKPAKYRITRTPIKTELVDVDTQVEVAQINMGENNKSPQIIRGSRGKITPSATTGGKKGGSGKSGGKGSGGGGGGKSSKPKTAQKKAPIEAKQAEDEIERYHEITKQIDNQSKLLDRLSEAKDSAYGPDKLKQMDKEIEATKTLINLNKQHIKEIRENLKLDKERAAGFGVTFDANGLINNYDEIIQQKMNEWLAEQQAIQAREIAYEEAQNAASEDSEYDADGSIKLAIDQDKEASNKRYENFKKAISQYEETYELFNDKAAELAERYREISEKTLEKIQYKIELKLDFNDLERQFIEVEQALLGDGWEKFSEAVWLADQNINTLNTDLETNKNGLISLLEQYNNGMNSAVFIEGAKELISNSLENIKDILSADADMLNMYQDVLDKANEEVSKWTDLVDAGINKLDHFKELSSLLRKDENNKWMDTILLAQQIALNNRYDVSKKQFEVLKDEYNALYTRWTREKDTLPEKELEMLETKLHAAASAMNEAEDQMLSDLQSVGEKAQEILENNISKAQKKLEKNLFGDTYENYMDQIDKLNLKQEEYLTNTNKMYETNKLIRQVQQDMDKTNNNRAKQQYNDYVKYIEQLQESGKLSNYELSIAQARYELLKAQIALEDAKDAKDQVRLTRDSEGNFGYVYTANQDKVDEAQQNFEDAQNKLYNIGLDGAKDYQAKSVEIYEKWQDEMQNIQEQYQSGQIASESEFREKQKETTIYYQGLLKQYNELYYTAHDLLVEESYNNTADYMLKGTISVHDFKNATGDYLSNIRGYYKDYDSTVEEIEKTVGNNLSSLKTKTGEVTTNTEKLSDMIVDKLLPSIDKELEAVRVKTSEYGAQRDAIWEVVEATKALLALTQKNEMSILSDNVDDYSLKIRDLLASGKYNENSTAVQQAIANRNSKLNGYDPYDYQAMMNEEAATNGTNTAWYRTLVLLRKQKLLNTDWMGKYNENSETNSWALNVREEAKAIDFAQELINLGKAFPGLTTDDDRVRTILNKRKAKIMDLQAKNADLSNIEPIASILERAGITDVSANGYSSTALYNTGGYTGAWGPEGKLAVLHEKELVLNAQDTENILSSVNILRQISQALDNSAIWASLGLGGLNAASIGTLADQTLQQEVHISADFPNVTDHNEIEMAIDNLINAASQYAYRK